MTRPILFALLPVLVLAGCAASREAAAPGAPGAATRNVDLRTIADAYYLSMCPVCNGPLGAKGETPTRCYAERDMRFCSDSCREQFESNVAANMARVDRAMVADQMPFYPLSTSIMSGRPLGPHPVDFIWGNRLFRVRNESERQAVLTDPANAIKALDRAVIQAQGPSYAMPTKCPVQGDILASDQPIDIVVANRMIRVCCVRCAHVVRARPSQYLSMIEYANRSAAELKARNETSGR